MTKNEIANKILDLLKCSTYDIVPEILKLVSEVREDAQTDDFCNKDWSGLQGGL